MIKVEIKKNNIVTNAAKFGTQEMADAWLQEQFSLKSFGEEGEYTFEMSDITAQVQAEQERTEALKYLAETDWMIIREMDAGIACPQEIKQARALARLKV